MPQIQTYDQQTNSPGVEQLPNVQAVSTPDFLDEGLSQLGQGMQSFGVATAQQGINQQLFKQQQAKQIAAIQANSIDAQTQLSMNPYMQQLKNSSTGAATGVANTFLSNYDNYTQQTLQQIPDPTVKNAVQEKLQGLRTKYGLQMQDFENQAYTADQVSTAQKTIGNLATLSAQSGGQTYQSSMDSINQMASQLNVPPELKQKFVDSASKQIIDQTAEAKLLNNPIQLHSDIGATLGKLPDDSALSMIRDAAVQQGVSPLMAVALSDHESGGVMNAQNPTPGSTAYGPLQITDATWKGLGGTDDNRNDPQVQAQLSAKLIGQTQNGLQASLGRTPTLGEMEAGIQFGLGTGAQIINSDPNTPIEKFISPDTAAANNISGKTTGQVMQDLNDSMQKSANKFIDSSAPWVQDMDTNQKIEWYNKSNEAIQKQDAAARTVFEQTIADQKAQATQGIIPNNQLNPQAFTAIYKDPTIANLKYQEYSNSLQLGKATNQLSGMSMQQAAQTYNSLTPQPNSFGYSEQLKNQQIFATAMANKQKALTEDPANYFNTGDSDIKAKYNAWQQNPNDPQATNDYLTAQYTAQQNQGIKNPMLLSKNDETQLLTNLNSLSGTPLVNQLNAYKSVYGSYYQPIMNQLQLSKNAPQDLSAILVAKDDIVKNQVATNSRISLSDKYKMIPIGTTPSQVNTQVASVMQPFYQSIDPNAIPGKTFDSINDAVTKLTVDNIKIGMSTSSAAQDAYNKLVGTTRYNYIGNNDGNTQLRIPVEYNKDTIQANLDNVIQGLNVNNVQVPEDKLLINPWHRLGNDGKSIDGYKAQIQSNSMWITNQKEDGAMLYFKADDNQVYPVLDKSGKQINASFQNLSNNLINQQGQNVLKGNNQ